MKIAFHKFIKSQWGYGGDLLRQNKMKNRNYIWDSVDTTNIKGDKPLPIKKVKIKKIRLKKPNRKYNKRKPRKYYAYIKSKYWRQRKNRYFQLWGKKCHICRSSKFIELHHLEYRSDLFGRETDDMLVPLCSGHHNEFHLLFGTRQKMYREFDKYVEMKYEEYKNIL